MSSVLQIDEILTVAPDQFAPKLVAMSHVLEIVELRIVNVGIARITPNRQVAEAESQWMLLIYTMKHAMLVYIASAVNSIAMKTEPVLLSGAAFNAMSFGVDF